MSGRLLESLIDHFSRLEEPRADNRWHLLLDIIAICAAISGSTCPNSVKAHVLFQPRCLRCQLAGLGKVFGDGIPMSQ